MTDFDRCIYCQATGCLDDTVVHDADCPQVTNVYPVRPEMLADPRGCLCTACDEPLREGDLYILMPHPEHWMMANIPPGTDAGFVTCLGCAALNREPSS